MFKKLFIVIALAALVLSACGGQAPSETVTPVATDVQAATATEAIATNIPIEASATEPPVVDTSATSTTLPTAIVTATLETPRPTNVANCTNSARFVADLTIPDNSEVGAGTKFTKTWRVSNTGTCIWGPDYTLAHYSDEVLGLPASVPLAITYPGQTLDISVDLTAPNSTGTHRGNFVIKNPAGLIMKVNDDSRLWVIINVTTATTTNNLANATAAPASTGASGTASAACAFTTDSAKVTEVISAVNAYRTQNGLPVYVVNTQLTQAAQAQTNDMACNNLFGHKGSNGSTPQTRIAAAGYAASFSTENVHGSYPPLTGQQTVAWWINDKTDLNHNRNLLSDTYTEIGVGYSFFNNFGYYAIVFATP